MAKYILKRLVTVLLVLWAASTLTYFTVHVTPGDMVRAIVVQTYGEEYVNEEVLANVRTRFDLDKPVIEQYANWLWDIFHFDFGISYQYNMPVEQLLAARIPNTLKLGAVAFMLATLVGIPLGILSAIKQNKFFDHITRIFTLAAGSFPSFWIALMVIILFSLKLHWFPTSGMESANSIVLPALTLAIGMVATTTRMVRTSMLDVLRQDYMVVAKSKGIRKSRVMWAHAFRNAVPSIITVLGLQIGHILGGAVLIENVFAWPGVGNLLNQAISSKDLPMVEGCVILIAFGYASVNLLVDIIYACVDPRVKYMEGK